MRVWLKRITIAIVFLFLVGCGVAWWAVRQTSHVPEFYTKAAEQLPEKTAEGSRRLQQDVQQLQTDAGKPGFWVAQFSDSEINSWLIEELPKRFPALMQRGVSDPRIAIEDGRILVAARYQDARINTVISCEVEVELTQEANMLALRLYNLSAGALPLPLDKFLSGITKEAAQGDIEVRWDMTDDGPVALVTVPSEHPNYEINPVIVESIDLKSGDLFLSGHTGALAEESFQPRGTVHQFVSFRPRPSSSPNSSRQSPRKSLERMR